MAVLEPLARGLGTSTIPLDSPVPDVSRWAPLALLGNGCALALIGRPGRTCDVPGVLLASSRGAIRIARTPRRTAAHGRLLPPARTAAATLVLGGMGVRACPNRDGGISGGRR